MTLPSSRFVCLALSCTSDARNHTFKPAEEQISDRLYHHSLTLVFVFVLTE